MNKTTYIDFQRKNSFNAIINENEYIVNSDILLKDFIKGQYHGSNIAMENEIIVSYGFLSVVLGESVDITNVDAFIGRTYQVELLIGDKYYTKNYEIVGIVADTNGVYFSENDYNYLFDEYSKINNKLNKGLSVTYNNLADNYDISKYILDNDYFYNVFITRDILAGIQFIDGMKTLSFYLTIFSLILLIIIIYFFTSTLITDNSKAIGILSSLGTSSEDISFIFSIETFKITIISIILAILANYIIIFYLNAYIIDFLKINVNAIKSTIYSIPIVIVISIFINLLSTYFPLNKLRKKDLLHIIYDKP